MPVKLALPCWKRSRLGLTPRPCERRPRERDRVSVGPFSKKFHFPDNPGTTTGIFERAINPLVAGGPWSVSRDCFLIASYANWLISFPWERIVSASTWRSHSCASPSSDSIRRSDEKAADVVVLGSHIAACRGSSRRSEHR